MTGTVSCQNCGNAIAKGDQFCPACGTAVVGADAAATEQGHSVGTNPTQCVKCSAPMARDDQFCSKCGASRPEEATVVSHVSLRNSQAAHLIEATAGEFEVLQQLGTGAMGAVYLAKDIALGRHVAIKVIAPNLLSDDTMISRFRLEAQTVASLRHPNIVNVHAVRQSDDLHYFVMEYIDGPPLRSIVKAHAPLDVDVARAILYQVGSALSYAHRTGGGVIHRDIKPANIMVDAGGDAFVTDFGISKIAEAKTGLTQTGATIGTPEYMSPEQCRGETLTGASDQYALGIVAYEMLCGGTPFGGTQYHVMVAHTSEEPEPIRKVRADCPAEVAEAVERMLAKDPADRWPDLDSAVAAMGGAPMGHGDPVRAKIKALASGSATQVMAAAAVASEAALADDTATSVTVTGLPSVLETGERFELRADVRGTGETSLSGESVVWASTDPSIARVDGGWVEALTPGTVSITASAGNVASSVLLTVREPQPAEIVVRPGSVRMQRGGRIGLTAVVRDRQGNDMDGEVTWSSSDTEVVTVGRDGQVIATAGGNASVTARCGEATGTANVVVEAPVAEPAPARPKAPTVAAPATDETPRQPRPRRPAPAPRRRPPAWRRASVLVPALVLLAGAASVPFLPFGPFAEDPVPSSLEVTLVESGEPVRRGLELELGDELSLAGVVTTADGALLDVPVRWESDDESVATVDGSGRVAAVGGGSARIRAVAGDSLASPVPVTVSVPATAVAIVGEGGEELSGLTVEVDESVVLGARVTDADGRELERTVQWSAADESVVTVTADGSARAAGPGSTTIVARAGDVSERLAVTVVEPVASTEPAVSTPEPAESTAPAPPTPVQLEIRVGPTFANLFVDGVLRDEGLRTYTIELMPGVHEIRLEHPRFPPHVQTIRIEPGQTPPPLQVQLNDGP